MYCCIHSTFCVPIMNGRRRGTWQESRKQAQDSAWSMEMSKLTRDGTDEPVSRDQILRREREQRIIHFPCSAADHGQDWQPCPVVKAIHTNIVLHTHTVVVTHIYIELYEYYTTTAVNLHECSYKPIQTAVLYQYIYMYFPRIQLTTSRFGSLTRLVHITLL